MRRTPLRPRKPYAPPRQTDAIPRSVREQVRARDKTCVGRKVGLPTECWGPLELDHVRASGGMGLKSESTPANLVAMCSACHFYKTTHGREVRPRLLAYIERVEAA